ncbi:Na+/H+ antiporter [Sediminibacterium soli]|uniref:Na+/H+ antiporter n=1 Tax=Sediminibacterium soli TaxID=2698829 RepID=UPI00137A415A|nr:Na+/H+ antiporter [Sediminibacterium soli]NCI46561.1 Na+/H+ antiporter [Sediminibacterium soli]
MENTTIIIFLLFGMAFIGILSNKYKFPLPIALVLCGVIISIMPGLPVIALNSDVVFVIFLPPLLYGAAWFTSWHEFKANLRPIGLAAIGLVIFTTVLVAVAAHWMIAGIGWPTAFLIGAIVSPPDAVAATSVTKGLGISPRLITILEGESLVNDASGLVAYKYALAAITLGNFVLWEAGLNFLLVASAGIAIGLVIGYLMYIIHKHFVCSPVIEVTFTFLTPFAAYLLAEHFHFSGVLAVVSTGLYLTFRSGEIFTNQSRIMAYSVWEVVMFILNGLVFILIGLQLRGVISGIAEYGRYELLLYAVIISLVVIIVRFVWVIPAAFLPRIMSRKIRETETLDRRNLVIFGWAGMRGVVSMAAALAIPTLLPDGSPFPHRNLIIYLSFCVILATLVPLGLTLPWIIRKMKMEPYSIALEEYDVRTRVVTQTITFIEENLALIQDDLLDNIKSKYEVKYNRLQRTDLPSNYFGKGKTLAGSIFNEFTQLQLDLIGIERKELALMHRKGEANEEILRKIERELDLEETRLQMEMYGG